MPDERLKNLRKISIENDIADKTDLESQLNVF